MIGIVKIDVADMKAYTQYDNYSPEDQVIKYFWEYVEELAEDQKVSLLHYITGSFSVPIEGFKNLNIIISRLDGNENSLPVAHSCSKELELPNYSTKEILIKKMNYALEEGSVGFYIG